MPGIASIWLPLGPGTPTTLQLLHKNDSCDYDRGSAWAGTEVLPLESGVTPGIATQARCLRRRGGIPSQTFGSQNGGAHKVREHRAEPLKRFRDSRRGPSSSWTKFCSGKGLNERDRVVVPYKSSKMEANKINKTCHYDWRPRKLSRSPDHHVRVSPVRHGWSGSQC